MVNVREDLTGKRFGRLTVIEQAEDILHGDFSYHNSQLIGNKRLKLFEQIYGANHKDDDDNENIS